jgi:hypothetical protein
MQIGGETVEEAAGQDVGLPVPEHAREHDAVFNVVG